jgi:hypothetical protein
MKTKVLLLTLPVSAACLLIGVAVWLAARPPQFSLAGIDAKIARLSQPGTTVKEAVHVLGEPAEYFWGGDESHIQQGKRLPNPPPDFYTLRYPQGVSVFAVHGKVAEFRSEGQGPGFTYQGKLRLGTSLDDVLTVLGPPSDTVTGKPLEFAANVLYKDIDRQKGYDYYDRPDQHIRCFFQNNRVVALYLPLATENR